MKKHSLSIILFFLCLVLSDVFSQTKVDWRQIKNTPTTVEGYGITDVIGTSVLDNVVASFTGEVVRIDSEIATITNELERVENLIPNNASFTFQGLSEIVGTVESENLANYSVTTVKLATDSVTTSRIADLNVTTDKIADYAITSVKMGAESVTRDALASGAVEADKLADDSVSNRALQDNSVSYETLDVSLQQTIDTANAGIPDNSIVGSKLATQTVTHDYLGYGSVLNDNIGHGEVNSNSIEDYSVDSNDLATASVDTRILKDLSVTNDKIANLAVTNSKIDFGAISLDRMAAGSVGSGQIIDKNVTEVKLADDAVVERVIASNSVTVDKIKDGEITPSKLNTLVSWSFDVLAVSTLNGGIINFANLTELPTSLAGALVFMNDNLYIKKSGYWDKLLAESDVSIPNNASFTLSGLGEKDFTSLTNRPTTLSGYGITDAAPKTHATAEDTYGLGTTANYGHVRTINTLMQTAHADGTALSAYQGYVLNNAVGAKLDKTGGTISGNLTVSGNITGTVSTATTALNALTADYAAEAGSSASSNNSDFATYAETAHTIVASSTQLSDTLPIAFESLTHPNSPSSYSGFYSPAHSTIVMRTGQDSYKFEYNQVTLGEDVTFIGRNADADEPESPNPLYISGSNTATTGGNIALGGYNNPYLSLRLKNKSLLYFSDGDIYPVRIASHTHIQGRLETSDYVSADALYGYSAQAERMTLTPIARSSLPVSMPSSGVMYFDYDDLKFYGRVNNSWQILNSSNSDFTLAGLSEKDYNSLTNKPTIPTNSSFTLAGLSEKNFSSLNNKPTTLSGYGITDGVNTSDSRLSDARTPLAHIHGNIANDGKIGTTSGLVVTTTTGGVLTTSSRSGIDNRSTFPPSSHALNSHTACTLAQINALITDATLIDTNDTRLSDARPASDVSAWAKASAKPTYTYSEVGAAASSHTHNYAGSSSAGGAATSANKLNTNAGSVTQPIYFANGVPVATTYSLGKSVPSNAVFTDTTYSNMVGATTSVAGTAGLVPAPSAGAATRYLRSDGTWQVPPDNNTTYTANNGVSLSGTTFSNSGVRSIATGGTNGTISVNTNGTSANVAVKGLGTAAYTASTAYAASSHTHNYAGSSSAGGSATTAEKVNNALTITFDSGTTEGLDKFTFDGSGSKTVDILAGKIQAFKYMTASETVYVGASETYKTINSALEYLSTRYPIYKSGGIIATIILRSGFIMKEQVIVNGLDFGWVRIASEDAEVVIDESYVTAPVPGDWYATQYAAFAVVNGGVLPIINALFKYGSQSSGTACGIISRNSTVIIEPSCGVKYAKGAGIIAINSIVYGKDSNFSGAYGDCAYFGGSCQAFMAGAILSGSVTGSGLTAENASTVSATNTDCSNCGNYSILANRGSVVTANSATLSGSSIGIYALHCSTVNADSSVITGITSDNSLYALQSSTINVTAASLSKAVVSDRGSNVNIAETTGATLAQVLFGGFISAYNASVTLSQPANTITANGIIFK